MAGVVQKPENINLSGNLNPFVIAKGTPVSFVLKKGKDVLLSQEYVPISNLIEIDIKEIVEAALSFTLDAADKYINTKLAETFTATVDETDYTFRVVRAGIANLADTAVNWLRLHFMTWQPSVKEVTYYSPEWLTYYAIEQCTAKLKATFADKSTVTISLGSMAVGMAYTFNMQYAKVAGLLGKKYPSYYEVWIEKSDGTKISESQIYAFSEVQSDDEQWYLFENSLGGMDTFRAFGVDSFTAAHEHNIAEFGDENKEYDVDTSRKHTKNTGHLDEYQRRWLLDFFPSKQKYVYDGSTLRKIVVNESNVAYDSNELPSSYTFTWTFAHKSIYMNLVKNENALPDNLVAPDLTSPDFILPPRLAELPRVALSEGVLIPSFDPDSPTPTVTTYGAVHETIKNAVVDVLIDEIQGIDWGSGGSGGSGVEIIKEYDLTVPTDENVFSSLRTLAEIKQGISDLDDRFIRKDKNDYGDGFYTWNRGWMTKGEVRSAEYNIGWEIEDPKGWYVAVTGEAWYKSVNVRGPILTNNIIGSPYYASGWDGFGSQWNMNTDTLETNVIVARRSLKAYVLDVHRIYGTNGDLAVSATNKIDRVIDTGTAYRCYIDTYDGEMYMNMRVDDVVICQTWEKKSGRYYMAAVVNAESDYFDLDKAMLEGSDTPAAGDVVCRWSSLSDADRMGLIYLSGSDIGAPYVDVRYGAWDLKQGSIKVRNGRLDGINDPDFPELYGTYNNFGLYTTNFYGKGDLILRSTGESVSRTFEVLKDQFKTGFNEVRTEIRINNSSVLSNPVFQEGMDGWETSNVGYPWIISGGLLTYNNKPFSQFVNMAIVVLDDVNNREVLQISDSSVIQRNETFLTKESGKYRLSFAYRSLLNFGTLEVGIEGTEIYTTIDLTQSGTYTMVTLEGEWDGMGDFVVRSQGGVVNVTDISFNADNLANAIEKVKVEYDTKLSVKADGAAMESFRKEFDEFDRVVREDYATQNWTATKISTEVGTVVEGKLTNYSTTSQTSQMINNKVADLNLGQYATTSWTSGQITNAVYNLNLGQYATTTWTTTQINSSVSDKVSSSQLNQTASDLNISFTNQISSVKGITDAFYSFSSLGLRSNRNILLGTGDNTIAGFVPTCALVPGSAEAFWCGNRYNRAIQFNHDGSGWLANKNITWDTSGNATFLGKITSNANDDKVVIDPSTRAVLLYSQGYNVASLGWVTNTANTINAPCIKLHTYLNLAIRDSAFITSGSMVFDRYGEEMVRLSIGGMYFNIDKNALMNNGTNQSRGSVYYDASGYLRIKL